MTIARSRLIDHSTTRWYHCVSRCVRRAFLLSEGKANRKEWIENRIKELAEIFAVGIGGFSVMFVGFSLGSYLLLVVSFPAPHVTLSCQIPTFPLG